MLTRTAPLFRPDYTRNHSDTVFKALVEGGTDADCPAGKSMYASYMMDALEDGAIARADIDRAARRVFRTIFRLGMLGTSLPNPSCI